MSLITADVILNRAVEGGYAVPAFNAHCFEMIPALVEAAIAEMSPLIIQIGKKYLSYTSPDQVGALALYLARRAPVPIAVHLDHGADLAMAKACLESGFTSVMYDGSSLPDDENIRNTKAVVKAASRYGVPVEGEIGQVLLFEDVTGHSERDFLTEPAQAVCFVRETGVSSIAVAVGNIHHMKNKQARLDFARIEELRRCIDIPLVIHGCSGVSDDDLRTAVKLGINKVNVATEYNLTFTDTLRSYTAANPDADFPMDALTAAMQKVTEIARERIRVLGADGKAR